ncbi:MAG: sodium:solute symporter family protein [Candidatus Methanosuratincola sp.]
MNRMLSALSLLDWAIVALYLAFSFLTGAYLARRAGRSMTDYFVSGRNLPWWALGTSMVATTFAADTPLVVTGWIRTGGIWKNWFWWNYLVSHVFIVFVFARLWRRAEVITDNELIELRYSGKPAAFLRGFKAFYFSTLFNFIVMGWVIRAMAKIMGVFFGFDATLAILICLAVAIVYTTLGGLWGVVMTDVFQYAVAVLGTITLAAVVVSSADIGGIGAFWAKVKTLGSHASFFMTPSSGGHAGEGFFDSDFFVFLIYVSVIWWSSHNSDGGGYIIQRLSSARDEKNATLGMAWFAVNHYIVRFWPWVVVALASLIVYPDSSPAGGDNEAMYVVMVKNFLGAGLRGLLFVTFLAAFMSTITTQLNWGVSYIIGDIYKRFIKPEATEAHYVLASRLCTVGFALVAGYVAFQIQDIGSAWIYLWAMSSGIGLVLVLRWFWWRINAWSEIVALSASLATITAVTAFVKLSGGQLKMKHQILVVPISIACSLAATLLTKPEPMSKLSSFYEKIRPWGFWKPVSRHLATQPSHPLRSVLLNWFFGVVFTSTAMLGVGKVTVGDLAAGSWLLLASLLSASALYRRLKEGIW